jgi:hypothetical protein
MVTRREASDPHASRLLGLLSPSDCQRLRPHLHRIPLDYRQSLYRVIETGVGSLVNTMKNGDAAEVGTIGNERLPEKSFLDYLRKLSLNKNRAVEVQRIGTMPESETLKAIAIAAVHAEGVCVPKRHPY